MFSKFIKTALVSVGFIATTSALAQSLDYKLTPRKIANDIYVIEGANDDFSRANGCNIINTGFILTKSGVVVINTGPSKLYGEQQRKVIANITKQPVLMVLNLNLHPDYFFGNQAYAGVPIYSTQESINGMKREGGAYADNLYRMCGDWMLGTESTPPEKIIKTGHFLVSDSDHELELIELKGHTTSDLLLVDKKTGVMFAGGVVFANRIPTTPHANIPQWIGALNTVSKLNTDLSVKVLVPSHGPVDQGLLGVQQTKSYLLWLDKTFKNAATQGQDISEVLITPIPNEYKGFAAIKTEFLRNVTHLYPLYEKEIFQKP